MKILLIIPPYVIDEEGRGIYPSKTMLPTGPLNIAQDLRQKGHEVVVVDLVFVADWKATLAKFDRPDILLISCHTIRNIGSCRWILGKLTTLWGRLPHTILGGNAGIDLGVQDFQTLGLSIDAVIRGYGHGLTRIIETKTKGDLTGPTTNDLPLPALDLLPHSTHAAYHTTSGGRYPIVGHGFGCLWQCNYCTARLGSSWVARPLHDIEAEVAHAYDLGYRHLWCVDNLVLANPTATRAFDAMVAEHGMTWSGMTRPELVVKRRAQLDRLECCTSIAIGVETCSSNQLTSLGRRAQHSYLETERTAFKKIREAGIESVAFVMLDLPGSVEGDFDRLLECLTELHPNTVSWSFYNPPGRVLIDEPRRHIPKDFGFYRWPLGYSHVPQQKVVQQAMILSGTYWRGWHVRQTHRFFVTPYSFGVRFTEGTVHQRKEARSPTGDVWEVWCETT